MAEIDPSQPIPTELLCGLVMPISGIGSYTSDHWTDVRQILTDAIRSVPGYKFRVHLVSEADEVGIIQKRIVQNLHNAEVIVCDVSGKNPNVMFELGMRLTFDKTTVIVKDTETDYSFDIGGIEHLTYPRDLRFQKVVTFKEELSRRIASSYKAAVEDSSYSPFLKNFGEYKVPTLQSTDVTLEKAVLTSLTDLQVQVASLSRKTTHSSSVDIDELEKIIAAVERYFAENMFVNIDDEKTFKNIEGEVIRNAKPAKVFPMRADFRRFLQKLISFRASAGIEDIEPVEIENDF